MKKLILLYLFILSASHFLVGQTLIKEVNRQPVHSASDFAKAVKQLSEKDSVLLLIREGEHTRFVVIRR